MAGKACHVAGSTTQVGLTQVLEGIQAMLQRMAKAGMIVWWCGVVLLSLLICLVGFGGVAVGFDRSDLGLLCFGLSLMLLSIVYFYHRRPDGIPMPRTALTLGILGLVLFLIAAALSRNAL